MASASLARIIDNAKVSLPGAMDGAIRRQLFNTLKEFFERSECWQTCIVVPIILTPTPIALYELPTDDYCAIVRLVWLEGGITCPPTSPSDPLARGLPKKGFLVKTGPRAHLQLGEYPSSAEDWRAHLVMTVVDPTNQEGIPNFPEWIGERYHDYLTSGVIKRMALEPKKPYSDMSMVKYHGAQFETGMNLARSQAQVGYVADGQSWRFPGSFRSNGQRFRW